MSDAPTSTTDQELVDLRAELDEAQIRLRHATEDLAESEADQRVTQARLEERTKAYALADQVRTEEREFLIGLLRPVIPDAPSFSGTLLEAIKAVTPVILEYMANQRRKGDAKEPVNSGEDQHWCDDDWEGSGLPPHWRVVNQLPARGSVDSLVLERDDGVTLEFAESFAWGARLPQHGYLFPSIALLGHDTEPEIVVSIMDEKFPRPFTFEAADARMALDEAEANLSNHEPELWRPTFRINDNVLAPWALSLRIVVTTHPGDGPLQALCFNRPDGYRVSWNEAQAEPGWYVFSGSSSYPVDRLVPGNVHDALRVASERFPYVEPATPESPAGWIRSGTSYRPVYSLGQLLPSGWRLVALQHTTDGFVDVISFFRDDGVTVRWQAGAAPGWYVHLVIGTYPGDIEPMPVWNALALVDRVRPLHWPDELAVAALPSPDGATPADEIEAAVLVDGK